LKDNHRYEAGQLTGRCDVQQAVSLPLNGTFRYRISSSACSSASSPACRYMSNFIVRNSDTRERLKVKNIYQDTRAEFLCVVFEV
jgi:hypothetical protein